MRYLEANCAGKKVNCAGNCAGLRSLANIVFSPKSTFSLTYQQEIPAVMADLPLHFTSNDFYIID